MGFNINATGFYRFLEQRMDAVQAAAVLGMHDATDHLLAVSRDEAPQKSNTLRTTAGKEVKVIGTKIVGEVFYNVTELGSSGVRFNYALRVHEMGEYKNPTTPGTRPRFLSRPLRTNERLYLRFIDDAIRRALR